MLGRHAPDLRAKWATMRASYQWLKELVPGLVASPDELAEGLTNVGLEVEAIDRRGAGLDAVQVAAVKTIEPHPGSDKLRLVTVDRGSAGTQQVVCGAPNVPDPGGLIVFAPLGTTLPAVGITLEPRKIRGVVSEGMICSESELGLSDGSEGIMILPPGTAEPGASFLDTFPQAADTIYEIGITPNRPDALGHVGIARDVAALYGLKLELPPVTAPAQMADGDINSLTRVDNEDTERCPHYGVAAVLDVTIAPSPDRIRWRLHALGIRPISNVVDLTNWILLEFGQPMHAFDLDLVREERIVVRRASAGEPFRTLDGLDRKLVEDDLVICDGKGPVALAGVMGGENTEIRDTTRRVLLECAFFEARGVRRTGRRHGLHTESSFRFERGTDWGGVSRVLDRAQAMLCELAGGKAVSGSIHAMGGGSEGSEGPELPTATLRSARLNALLGIEVPFEKAASILRDLGFEIVAESSTELEVKGASWRPDVSLEADFIEEVARIRGLDDIPAVLPAIPPTPPTMAGRLERDVSSIAVGLGLSEAVTYSFVSRGELEGVKAPPPVVSLKNPMTEERNVLRTSLLPGLVEAVRRARRRGERDLRLFATGPIFLVPTSEAQSPAGDRARPRNEADLGVLPEERPTFTCVLAGTRPAYLAKPTDVDVFDAKAVAVEMVARLLRRTASIERATDANDLALLHPRGAGVITVDGRRVGRLGPLHPDIVDALDLDGEVQVVEFDLAALESIGSEAPRYRSIPRLPAVTRDVALVISDDVPASDVEALLTSVGGELCESIKLFDLFRGQGIPDAHRSLAFHVVYRDPKAVADPENARTLTDKEVDALHAKVVQAAKERYGASLRA